MLAGKLHRRDRLGLTDLSSADIKHRLSPKISWAITDLTHEELTHIAIRTSLAVLGILYMS